VNRHDVTDEQWEGLADVVPLRGGDAWPSWPGHRTLPRQERPGEGRLGKGPPCEGPPGERRDRDPRRFVVLRVQCFSDARQVAECVMGQAPVLLDLTGAEADVAKRVLDFSSGVAFGLGARMHRVDTNVFLLTPAGTEVEEPRVGAAAAAVD
jgi:hypothetical protein